MGRATFWAIFFANSSVQNFLPGCNRTQAPGKEEEAEVVGWRPCVAHLPVGEEDVAVAEVDVVVPQVAVHQRLQVLELILRSQFSAYKIGVFL
jgi:hypothetical protein